MEIHICIYDKTHNYALFWTTPVTPWLPGLPSQGWLGCTAVDHAVSLGTATEMVAGMQGMWLSCCRVLLSTDSKPPLPPPPNTQHPTHTHTQRTGAPRICRPYIAIIHAMSYWQHSNIFYYPFSISALTQSHFRYFRKKKLITRMHIHNHKNVHNAF